MELLHVVQTAAWTSLFGTSWELWMGLQEQYELQVAEEEGIVERIRAEVIPYKSDPAGEQLTA